MSLYVPPKSIVDLVDVEDGRFAIDYNATQEQVAEFEEWRNRVEAEERSLDSAFVL